MSDIEPILKALELKPLQPEGGYFARTWTSPELLPSGAPVGTAIYFLLTRDTFSAFHRLRSSEVWHYYAGDSVEHVQIDAAGELKTTQIGPAILLGQRPQLAVPAGVWQAAHLAAATTPVGKGWSLLGCTMSPGWRDEDFELGAPGTLLATFPQHAAWVRQLARS